MQRKMIQLAGSIHGLLLAWIGLLVILSALSSIPADAHATASTPTVVVSSPSTPAPSIQPAQGQDSGLLVVLALIGAGGGVLAALIAGLFVIYQVRRTAQVEKQRQDEQLQHEKQRQDEQLQHEKQRQAEQFQHEEQLARLQKELEAQYKVKEQQEQNDATKAEALRLKMLLAQGSERAQTYREALLVDPRVSRLQILDMSRPLEVTNVYVRLRLHEEPRATYELDSALRAAERQRDLNALLEASASHLQQRASQALDPDEAIHRYKRCVVVGDPGAGKTTLLKYLTLKSAGKQLSHLPDLPIRIELNAFASSGFHDLLDFAAADWDERYGFPKQEARVAMEEPLKTGHALLLLDALDETVIGSTQLEAEASYQRVSTAISQVATRYPQAPIVVTVRKAGYQQRAPLTGFTELEVLDFRLEDIQQFVTNWFNCYTDPQKRATSLDLNTKLDRNPRMQALAANPLLHSLIVLVYEAQLDLPERRAELYKRCIETLLTEWDAERNIRRRRAFKPDHKRQLLAELAWHFHQQGRRYFPENEVLSLIADFLPKVRLLPEDNGSVLAEIASEHGLLKEQARGWQGFLHLTLQEYFVAQYVADYQKLDLLLAHRADPWWEEVLLLYAGLVPDASALLRQLLGQDGICREDIFHTNLILAGRCLTARPFIGDVALWDTIIHRLFDLLTTERSALIRNQVVQALAAIGGMQVNQHLLHLLSDERLDVSVRQSIAFALGRLGGRSVAADLMRLLTDKQLDIYVRESIAEALGSPGERSVVPDLMHLLTDKQLEASVRESIAEALGRLGERNVAPELVRLLSDKQLEPPVRWKIAWELGSLGERSVASDLMRLLTDKQLEASMRERIAEALGKLGECSVVPDLMRLLTDRQIEASVRERIAEALGRLRERSMAAELAHLLTDKQLEASVRERIAEALGSLGERSVVPELVRLLSDKQLGQSVREIIAEALSQLAIDLSSVQMLMPLLHEPWLADLVYDLLSKVSRSARVSIFSTQSCRNWLAMLS